ncbi:hypothetical protein Trco_004810 [Trichoderma cornu-damae]|uniref:Piwi domain-containing protein n=1 Tax=Trichoderma cornu-damae TaxID=654480 RepID=A0A9P8QNB7_9HYPO|nr:hypothetical protein Trco_004810 [Trichoderma cornu-damae]
MAGAVAEEAMIVETMAGAVAEEDMIVEVVPREGIAVAIGAASAAREETVEVAVTEEVEAYDGVVPAPDSEITKLENQIVERQSSALPSITSQMAGLSVKGKGGSKAGGRAQQPPPPMNDRLPARPAFGANGRPVVLWANYFKVNVKSDLFFKYTMDVKKMAAPKQESKRGGKAGSSKGGEAKEVKGRERFFVIKAALAKLLEQDKAFVAATEFKDQLITLNKISLVENPIVVQVPKDEGGDEMDTYAVQIYGPNEIQVGNMKQYMASMTDGPDGSEAAAFPRFPDAADALNIILGHGPRSDINKTAAIGSSRFFPIGNQKVIEELTQNWRALTAARGYFQSTRIATGRMLLNANVTHGVFRISGRMVEILDNLQIKAVPKSEAFAMRKLRSFGKFLPKARVWVNFKTADGKSVRRSKAIRGLATVSDVSRKGRGMTHPPKFDSGWEYAGPKNLQFWLDSDKGGRYISVFDYYKQKYGVTLRDYPLLDLGSEQKPFTYFPAEMVEIQPGQAIKASLTMEETTAMLDFACRSPYSNALSISTASRQVLELDDPSLKKFGVSVENRLLTVQGRVLNAPTVSYFSSDGRRKPVDVRPLNGAWNMKFVRVIKPGNMIERWTWVNLSISRNARPVEKDVVLRYGAFLSEMGIAINKVPVDPPSQVLEVNDPMSPALEAVFQWLQKKDIQLFVIILSEKDSSGFYARIKTLGDCTFGIHTSCVVARSFGKGSPAYFANVGLKINLKAGGVNHKLREELSILKDGKTMVVGYDVTHPTNMAVQKGNEPPSLVGFVASIDKDLGQWPALAWEQTSKMEMLSDKLVDAFTTRLDTWSKHNGGRYPENIIIYRDGVSEGQFTQVLDQELPCIREACRKKYSPQFHPKLTIVVSVKRHQTRFYPSSADDMSKSGNIVNGTVVDRGVTQARYWDFFLTAHDALQGTARPAHYTVLLDEIFRSKYGAKAADELERLTHELCYLYGRATKAVSICPPAYYADIVCERARAHRPEWFDTSDSESMTTATGAGRPGGTAGRQVHVNLRNSMYYI